MVETSKVSVCITAYNHGPYIRQALDSVLEQKTDFKFQIIIGEDDSEDDTREIALAYAKDFPDQILLLLNSREDVIYINGRPTGNWNFFNNLVKTRSEYVALLDGDDYWVDDMKLQKQVDFLNSHQDYSMCFTDARIWDEECSEFCAKTFHETHAGSGAKRTVQFSDMVSNHWIPTGSVMYRRSTFEDIPAWFYRIPMADWGLFLSLLDKGPGRYMDECTSVYRIHSTSYWSSLPVATRMEGKLQFLRLVRNEFGFRKGLSLNQAYCQLTSEQYRRKNKTGSTFLRFYYKAMQKLWRILLTFEKN